MADFVLNGNMLTLVGTQIPINIVWMAEEMRFAVLFGDREYKQYEKLADAKAAGTTLAADLEELGFQS